MSATLESNQYDACLQELPLTSQERLLQLKVWKILNKVTWVEMGKHMTALKGDRVTGNAVQKALEGERMPVENHKALLKAYPHLPPKLLPRPENTNKTYNPGVKTV